MNSLNRDRENESFGTGNCEFWLSSDIDTSTSDWSEVDKRLKAIYETAASIDDRSDFNCLLPALHSELEKVRQEAEDNMRKRCVKEFIKVLRTTSYSTPMDNSVSGFIERVTDQATQNINNLDKE